MNGLERRPGGERLPQAGGRQKEKKRRLRGDWCIVPEECMFDKVALVAAPRDL